MVSQISGAAIFSAAVVAVSCSASPKIIPSLFSPMQKRRGREETLFRCIGGSFQAFKNKQKSMNLFKEI